MNDWKDDILNSLEGLERATPPPGTFDKIRGRIGNHPEMKKKNSVYWMAAAVLLILGVNAAIVSSHLGQDTSIDTEEPYSELITDFNLYE